MGHLAVRRGPNLFSPDFGDDIPDRRQSVLVVTTTTLVISTIFIVARLVSRLAIVRNVTWDDYCIIVGWVRNVFSILQPNLYFNMNFMLMHDSFLLLDCHSLLHMALQRAWGFAMWISQMNGYIQ